MSVYKSDYVFKRSIKSQQETPKEKIRESVIKRINVPLL